MNPLQRRERDDSWNPFRELERIQNEMNRLFDFSITRAPEKGTALYESLWAPAIDIHETKDSIVVKADLPGLKKEEIDVQVDGPSLVIKGERKHESEQKENGYLRTERAYGSFYRELSLPSTVDASNMKASYKDGVLELVLPKKEEAKPKKINVEVQ